MDLGICIDLNICAHTQHTPTHIDECNDYDIGPVWITATMMMMMMMITLLRRCIIIPMILIIIVSIIIMIFIVIIVCYYMSYSQKLPETPRDLCVTIW